MVDVSNRSPKNGPERQPGGELLSVDGVSKRYGATVALKALSLDLKPHEVHAILGENGAGKSTLVRILSGAVRPNSGTMLLDGKAYTPHSILDARGSGVSTAFQELSLLPNLTVTENLLLPAVSRRSFVPDGRGRIRREAEEMLSKWAVDDIGPCRIVGDLSLAEKQRLEIMRALSHASNLLILDEPTAALPDVTWLFDQIARLTAQGVAVLYISHRLSEVRELCERATVLRNGESIDTVDLKGVKDDQIFSMMVGRSPDHAYPAPPAHTVETETLVEARGLVTGKINGIDLTVQTGEIVGVAGLEGQGQLDLFRALVGLAPQEGGEILSLGKSISPRSPRHAMRAGAGFAYVPEERKVEGIFGGLTAAANMSLPKLSEASSLGVIHHGRDVFASRRVAEAVSLSERYFSFPVNDLSGGNQQKVVLARAVMSGARCLVLFDPTRGVDVGTKQAVYAMMRDFVAGGGGILVYSSELSELTHLCHRCLVIYRGSVFAEAAGDQLTEEYLLAAAHGHPALSVVRKAS